jgi:hypothetical protein
VSRETTVRCDECGVIELLGAAKGWLFSPSRRDFCPNCIIRLDDDPFAKMDIPEDELPFVEITQPGIFIQILDPDLVCLVRRKEGADAPIPKKGGKE